MLTGILSSRSYRQSDPLLRPFLRAGDGISARRALESLLAERVQPLLRKIIGRKFGVYFDRQGEVRQETASALDVQDLLNDVQAAIIGRLWNQRDIPDAEPISGLENYVAMAAHRACTTYFRSKKPKWSQLKSALRYLLTHQAGLAEWRTQAGVQVSGFSEWQTRKADKTSSQRLVALLLDPPGILRRTLPLDRIHGKPTADVVAAIFNHLGHPLETDDLVNVCAALYQVKDVDASTGTPTEDGDAVLERVMAPGQSPADQIEGKEYLRWLWEEIQSSPPKHRQSLLLNFRDGSGNGVLPFLVILGIAALDQIAASLEISLEDLARIWSDLPWDDLQVGVSLGLTRQQVIDCRKNCRKRLERRSAAYGE